MIKGEKGRRRILRNRNCHRIEEPPVPNDQIEGETDFAGWCQMVERCKCSERLQNEGESKLCVSARQIEEWMEWEQLCKMVPLLPPSFPSFPSDAGSHHSLASQQPHYIDHGSFGDYSFYLIMSICNVHARSHLHIDRSQLLIIPYFVRVRVKAFFIECEQAARAPPNILAFVLICENLQQIKRR